MDNQSTVFDQCKNKEDIHTQLQHLAKELVAIIQEQHAFPIKTPGENAVIDLSILSGLSYGDLKAYTYPVFLLSEICRLLIKLGDNESLKFCLALSHTIYSFKCTHNESWYISYLYKGIAQIGLHITDLGIKNVSIGIAEQHDFSLVPIDKALGYWALMSAAIANRNLKLASTFAQKWQHEAQKGHLEGEIFRARLVMLLLQLLFGEQDTCSRDIKKLVTNPPEEWEETVSFLAEWTRAVNEGKEIGKTHFSEPYPLFLGIAWYTPPRPNHPPEGEQEHDLSAGDFRVLCEVRRNFCHNITQNRLSTEDIEEYADVIAQWELPRPLHIFEMVLKQKDWERYFQRFMTRLLGKSVLQKVLTETPIEQDVVIQNNTIILVMDVRKYSALSEECVPNKLFDLLNPIFKIVSEELEQAGGTILEFIGDCIIVVFNTFKDWHADISEILPHTIRCLQRIYVLNTMALQPGLPEIRIGVGIHKGPVALGYLGGLQRCHLTVLGDTINLATRLETASKTLPGDVIISASCFDNHPPDVWIGPPNVNFSIRDLKLCKDMKNISRPVHVFGVSPLLRSWVDFVPMGFVARPEKGVIYLDVGNSGEPGIIDHHYEGQTANSACELLNQHPELLLEHIRDTPTPQIEFRLHNMPDLDCAATLYTAYELMDTKPRTDILSKLAEYVSSVDQARIPLPEQLSDSLYGVFQAHRLLTQEKYGTRITDLLILEAELRVIDAAVYLMEQHLVDGDFASIFQLQPTWFAEEKRLLEHDKAQYNEDLKSRSHTYTARINGAAEPVIGLWLDHPQSVFFRLWGWNDPNALGGRGYRFLAIDLSQPGKNRFVIGVDPNSGTHINGLGQLLEEYEARKRKELGKERPIHPIRYPANNSDPWYFGQGHNYAVIDSPGEGTVLTAEEVQKIHESWQNDNYRK
jgi:class 3 adenylate cyclase